MSDYLLPSSDAVTAYSDLRSRMSEMLDGAGDEVALARLPHCPLWTVKDALAHMIGVVEDILIGNVKGVTTAQWTQAQVDRHRSDSLSDLFRIWNELMPKFEGIIGGIPQPTLSQFVLDQVSHEHDVRAALGRYGAQDSLAVAVAGGFWRHSLSNDHRPRIASLAISEGDEFCFVRSLSGRRSRVQIAQCGIDADAVAEFLATSPFSIPEEDIFEDASPQ